MAQHYTPGYEVGEIIPVRARAVSPFSPNRTVVEGLIGTAEVFAPSKDPVNVPADRAAPDASDDFAFVAGIGYVAYIDTTGLAPAGVWTLRARLHDEANDEYDCVEYMTFTLRE